MHKRLLEANYRFRPARPSRFWEWALTPVRRHIVSGMYGVAQIDLRGHEHVLAARADGAPVMFVVNHPAHGDPFMIFEAMGRLKVPCCYMAAWQVLTGWLGVKGWAFRRLGAFSVDREGTDVRSFRAAVDVLAEGRRSLVIFPEGEVYHLNDRVTPMRQGAAMVALAADRRRRRGAAPGVSIVPCALKYFYLEDPTPVLEPVMSRLEASVHWRPRNGAPLSERVYRFAEAVLALKEIEYTGSPATGPLAERIARLTEHILSDLERRRSGQVSGGDPVPQRVKNLRQRILQQALPGFAAGNGEETPDVTVQSWRETLAALEPELEDLHLVIQLFSYPGDYVAERPSIERIAETIDKFEEDALGAHDAGARAPRRAVVAFGPPLAVAEHADGGRARTAAGPLTAAIEQAIQTQLDRIER